MTISYAETRQRNMEIFIWSNLISMKPCSGLDTTKYTCTWHCVSN
jgi:hypothetical protein